MKNSQVYKPFKINTEMEEKINENVSEARMKGNKVKQRQDTLNQRSGKNISQVSKDKSISKKDKDITNNNKHKSIKSAKERW